MQVDETGLPPFLERLSDIADWGELVAWIRPGQTYVLGERITDWDGVFDDPVTCRLYEALYRFRRQEFIRSLAKEFYPELSSLEEGSVVVEVGCGPGLVLLELAKLARHRGRDLKFVGYDPSCEMIHIANEHRDQEDYTEVRFLCTDAGQPAGRDVLSNSLLVLVRNVLAWVSRPEEELCLWRSVLPEGATIISREVRRDIPFEQFKRRLIESCYFQVNGQTLYYPIKEYTAAFLCAHTASEHESLLRGCFKTVEFIPPRTGLLADENASAWAESQLRCRV